MSGTSLDGIDAALVETDGITIRATGASAYVPYDAGALRALPVVMQAPLEHRGPGAPAAARQRLAEAEGEVTRLHARAAAGLIADAPAGQAPAVLGFPGQTVAHAPERAWTWQLGDGAALARALNRPVVWDFRSDDIAAGGQGAPLAPFFHHAAVRGAVLRAAQGTGQGTAQGAGQGAGRDAGRDTELAGPVAVLNIGGVANVTWVDPSVEDPAAPGALVAFDTGPGNALVNDWMQARTGQALDRNGTAAARGAAEGAALVARFETNFVADFLARPAPKSLDRNAFNTLPDLIADASVEAGAAALTRFTVHCAAASLAHLPAPPVRWLVCGGGRHNPTMMRWLAEALSAPVDPVETVGLDGDMLEAQAFAYLAVRVRRGLPTSAPGTTGARAPVSGGRVARPG
ncbi:MAG: anhydro-N-acetylmuramic acid kinase [Pseudomonadota bacterium]